MPLGRCLDRAEVYDLLFRRIADPAKRERNQADCDEDDTDDSHAALCCVLVCLIPCARGPTPTRSRSATSRLAPSTLLRSTLSLSQGRSGRRRFAFYPPELTARA